MKITEVIAHHLSYTVERPYRNCCSPWITSRPATLLEVKTDNGLVGWGEGGGVPSQGDLEAHVIGRSPFDYEVIWDNLSHGGSRASTACGVEMALWDLMGKSLDLPVCQLLGGAKRREAKAYASGFFQWQALDHVQSVVDEAKRCRDLSFGAVKLRIGFGVEIDEQLVGGVREALGDDVEVGGT